MRELHTDVLSLGEPLAPYLKVAGFRVQRITGKYLSERCLKEKSNVRYHRCDKTSLARFVTRKINAILHNYDSYLIERKNSHSKYASRTKFSSQHARPQGSAVERQREVASPDLVVMTVARTKVTRTGFEAGAGAVAEQLK